MMNKQAFIQLRDKIADGNATEHELLTYNEMINSGAGRKTLPIYNRKAFRYLAAACIVLTVTALGAIFYNNHPKPFRDKNRTVLKSDVEPGGSKAILLLGDGTRVLLGDTEGGEIAAERGVSITETKDGQLIYKVNNSRLVGQNSEQALAHTLITPRGGQYQVILPDGTIAWLNASSSLKFPISFTAEQQNVELTGEAYFEVAESRDRPFVVEVGKMKVEGIGTHFNIMSYPDEQYISAMPVQGSVKVIKNKETRIVLPGQQARVTEAIHVANATDKTVEWKNGLISFENADIGTIMRQVARWYDVEVNYKGDIPDMLFTGEISRKANLSELIQIIGLDKMQLELEGKVITVMP